MKDIDRLYLIELIAKNLPQSFVSPSDIAAVFGEYQEATPLIEKQLTLAKRLAGVKDEEGNEQPQMPLLSIMARLKNAKKENEGKFGYFPSVLNPEEQNFIIPTVLENSSAVDATQLWKNFVTDFRQLSGTPTAAVYQTVFALLHKYTARIQASPQDPDVSLYDQLRTTAAIAACITREDLSEADINDENPQRELCMLLKGDISGIQNFLYQILSDGAARQLRGRSFYLQLLTEAIAHWVLRQLKLPIANLLLASGGHFYILAPYTKAHEKLAELQREISEKLWALHQGDLSFILAGTPVTAEDFNPDRFSEKWDDVSKVVNTIKQRKWSELETEVMFTTLFEPFTQRYLPVSADADQSRRDPWQFRELGGKLRNASHLIVFETEESINPDEYNWETTMKAFGWSVHFSGTEEDPPNISDTQRAIVYRLGDTDFLEDNPPFASDGIPVSYDFKLLPQVIPREQNGNALDYNNLADASEGVHWFGALRMDVDDLGTIFRDALGDNATISRMATLSEAIRLFFEGYVPQLCRDYNGKRSREILELIYAGGDDLFLVGGWSALPEIAKKIRDEFRRFVTGEHVTLSGGIFIEHQKFPLYQFAERSGDAEGAAKNLQRLNPEGEVCKEKDAISFLQKPMAWTDFERVTEWHQKFLRAVDTNDNPLPRDILTRLSQIYSDEELKGRRWAWCSLYYFHRVEARYKRENQRTFLKNLRTELNKADASFELKKFIRVVTRWVALQTRK